MLYPDGNVGLKPTAKFTCKRQAITLSADDDKTDSDGDEAPRLSTLAPSTPSSSLLSTTALWETSFNQYLEANDIVEEGEGIVSWWGVSIGLISCFDLD